MFTDIHFNNWPEAEAFLYNLDERYAFRGQGDSKWRLTTSIERSCPPMGVSEIESMLRTEFQSAAHLYESRLPDANDIVSWLSLMQHHGVPTRLMDWTRSPHVAAYFAAVHPGGGGAGYSIYALDLHELKSAAVNVLKSHGIDVMESLQLGRSAAFRDCVANNRVSCVAPVQSRWLNQRQTNQRALFLCQCDVGRSFAENLEAMRSQMGELGYKVILPDETRTEALRKLCRLNVQPSTLFPGIGGFSEGLALKVRLLRDGVAPLQLQIQQLPLLTDLGFI